MDKMPNVAEDIVRLMKTIVKKNNHERNYPILMQKLKCESCGKNKSRILFTDLRANLDDLMALRNYNKNCHKCNNPDRKKKKPSESEEDSDYEQNASSEDKASSDGTTSSDDESDDNDDNDDNDDMDNDESYENIESDTNNDMGRNNDNMNNQGDDDITKYSKKRSEPTINDQIKIDLTIESDDEDILHKNKRRNVIKVKEEKNDDAPTPIPQRKSSLPQQKSSLPQRKSSRIPVKRKKWRE